MVHSERNCLARTSPRLSTRRIPMRVRQEQGEVSVCRTVVAVSPVAVVQQEDTIYRVKVELEPSDLNLLPGMNVGVEILTD